MALQSQMGLGHLTVESSRSHSDTPHSVGLLWTSDQPDTQTLPNNTQHSKQTNMLRRDSNPQSQQASGRRLSTSTMRLWGSAVVVVI